ncbi:ATP-grasp domain-containing protein [Rhodopila globiformis]|uniref:ATP-grasp domain-containing protein n=1 Tax=Rhodopila globiformis TaxID=1071 RepID=A0A2S6N462_RHOGL|nr:RimK family alpha-L-glutamate ligase [Rhodopila globiformis]PPQ29421.1 hypothetical protein CCS01_21630 [Rhodopila globiformis]
MFPAADWLPTLDDAVAPPAVLGAGALTSFAFQGDDHDALVARIGDAESPAARLYDTAIACQLAFRRVEGLALQDEALALSPLYRVRRQAAPDRPSDRPSGRLLRLLALMAPGDLMVNTPLEFITGAIDVRLDLLYLLPDRALPRVIPDHDVAFFAVSEADAPALARLRRLFDAWPRPALNDPRFLPLLARDALARSLANVPAICSPPTVAVTRAALAAQLDAGQPPATGYPCLIRPSGSHAGAGLMRAGTPAELAACLRRSFARDFYLTAYQEYAGPDGLYHKSRIAFIDRRPFLCHMASSQDWMVHYLNAGMTESADRRAAEAYAMANFDLGFARRHEAAFAALHDRLGFDYYAIDCAETHDGRLLVFEADTAAIVHLMDPPNLFPYKPPQMRKVFAAFEAMLRRRAGRDDDHDSGGHDTAAHDTAAHDTAGHDTAAHDTAGHDTAGHDTAPWAPGAALTPPVSSPARTARHDPPGPAAGRRSAA